MVLAGFGWFRLVPPFSMYPKLCTFTKEIKELIIINIQLFCLGIYNFVFFLRYVLPLSRN